MGYHVESVYSIKPEDDRNLFVFVFGIPPWTDEYHWIEENFFRISSALGTDGLLIMGDGIDNELSECYLDLERRVQKVMYQSDIRWSSPGLVVTNVNPHSANKVNPDGKFVFMIPVDKSTIGDVVTAIVDATQDGNLERLRELNIFDEKQNNSYLSAIWNSLIFQPKIVGLGADLKKLATNLKEIRERRHQEYHGRPPKPALSKISKILLKTGFIYPTKDERIRSGKEYQELLKKKEPGEDQSPSA